MIQELFQMKNVKKESVEEIRERDAETAVDVTAYTIHFPSKHRKIESPYKREKEPFCHHSRANLLNKIMSIVTTIWTASK